MANLTVQKVENNKAGITPILKDLQDPTTRSSDCGAGRNHGPGQP